MKITRPIKTEAENERTLERIAAFMEKPRLTRTEADELELLSILVEAFEQRAYPTSAPNPVEAVKIVMEQRGYTRLDLGKLIGGKSRASEFLSGKRGLSMRAAKRLRTQWRVPASALL